MTRNGVLRVPKYELEPASEPHIRDAAGVVRVVVREQQRVDAPDRHLELVQTDGRAPAGVDQKLLVAGLDERARAEPLRARDRHAGPEQRHPEIALVRHCCILMPESLTTFPQ